MSGISYGRAPEPGRAAGEAEPIWFKGSQLGKAYGWNQVGGLLRDATPARGEHTRPVPASAPAAPAAQQRGDVGGELAEPLERSLELTPPSVEERRAQALAGARERAADLGRPNRRNAKPDSGSRG